MCWTHRNALYEGILVVDTYYDKIENLMKKWCQNDPKIDAKIDIWAIKDTTFEVFGGVLRNAFFYDFWGVQKVDQKWEKFDAWAALGARPWTFGAGRRQRRSSWEPSFGSFGEEIWKNVRHA